MKRRQTKFLSLAITLLFVGLQASYAQFTASGTVVDADSEPLPGVSIVIKGSVVGTITDYDGNFTIECPDSEAVLIFSYIGYTTIEEEFSMAVANRTITLADAVTQLDEVVITGLASSVKRENLANSVARVEARDLTGVTTQPTLDGAMYGKFKGAEIRANSGAPGGGMSVRLRGVTSIFGDQQPLYIVDGVYIDNSTISSGTNVVSAAAGGGSTETNQDDASNRIADIDPEDIESIEILKGASAAAIYGSRAAGGVIIITTKRGQAGETKVTFSQAMGFARPTRLLGDRGWTEDKVRDVYGEAEVERFRENGINDYEAELYDNTRFMTTSRLEIYGGNAKTNYLIGGTYKNDDGIVQNTGYEKASVRVNVGHKFTDWFDLDVTTNYINSTSDRGFFNNGNTNTTVGYALAFTRPWDDLFPDENGNYPANPRVGSNVLETVAKVTNRENINRFIGGATANFKIITTSNHSLRLALRGGVDQYTLRTTSIFPQDLTFYQDPSSLGGVSIQGNTVNTNTNMEAVLVYSWYSKKDFSIRAQAGVIQQDFDLNTVITTSTMLNGSQTNLDQAGAVSVFQNREPQQDKGFFTQVEGNWGDKIIATVGIRGDKSSNNGDANQLYYYPRANAAVNLHNFDFWSSDFINNLKLRVAFGQAGRFANFPDRFNAYNGTLIQQNSGLETDQLRGNSDVAPEIQSETEFGTDIGFWNNRVGLDFTYYIKNVDDLLLRAQVPTSTGFTRQVVNAGELENRGFELGLQVSPIRRNNFNWDARFSFWQNRSEVTQLDIPAFNLGGFAASLGQYRIEQGKSATQIVGTYNPDDCGTPDCSDIDPEGDGFAVYGDAEPDFNLTWQNGMTFGNFEFTFLFHWKKGGDGVNLSTLLYDLAGTTWDYDDTDLDPSGEQVNGDYRTSEWFAGNASPWIENAGYLRLREVGVFYTIPEATFNDVARIKVGVSARNVINIFDYNSYDPEVSNFGGNVLANSIEVTPYPYARTVMFHLRATF